MRYDESIYYRVMVCPTGHIGEAPARNFEGEGGYEAACEQFGWLDYERDAVYQELMANGGEDVRILQCPVSETAATTSVGR